MKYLVILDVSIKHSKKKILEKACFQVEKNSVSLLLGKNGVGKTSLLNSIVDANDYEGSILVNGERNSSIKAKKNMAFIPDEVSMPDNEKVISFIRDMYYLDGKSWKEAKELGHEILSKFGLDKISNQKIKELSLGQKKKLIILQSLASNPELMIFDEPLNSLDIDSKIMFINEISKMQKKGKTFLISTHNIEMFESIATDFFIIKNKKVTEFKCGKKKITDIYKEFGKEKNE